MKILVIGRTGQIGAELCQMLAREQIPYVSPTKQELDIACFKAIDYFIQQHCPTIIVNVAGYRSAKGAELESSLCFKLNRDAVTHLAIVCAKYDIVLLHISSWRVFSGHIERPYAETDTPNPLNILGNSFWQGEQQIREYCPRHIILRLSWVLSFRNLNRLTLYLRCMRRRIPLPVDLTCFGNPTTAWDVARVIVAICKQVDCDDGIVGTYHYAADGVVSEVCLAAAIYIEAKKVQMKHDLIALYAEKKEKYRHYACLDCTLLRDTFGIQRRCWRTNLASLVTMHVNYITSLEVNHH